MCFSYPSNNKIITFTAAWREKDMKIMFAILSPVKFVKNAVLKFSKALGTPKIVTTEYNMTK